MEPNPQDKKTALASAREQLADCKDEVAALKEDLAECRDAAELDHSMLKSGLRLAMENEALRKKVRGLLDDHEKPDTPVSGDSRMSKPAGISRS
jgi:hypothetical protein